MLSWRSIFRFYRDRRPRKRGLGIAEDHVFRCIPFAVLAVNFDHERLDFKAWADQLRALYGCLKAFSYNERHGLTAKGNPLLK